MSAWVTRDLDKLPLAALPSQSLQSPYMHHSSGGTSPSSYHIHPSLLSARVGLLGERGGLMANGTTFQSTTDKGWFGYFSQPQGHPLGHLKNTRAWFLVIHWWKTDVDCSLQILLDMHVLNDPSSNFWVTSWGMRWMKSGTRKNGRRSWRGGVVEEHPDSIRSPLSLWDINANSSHVQYFTFICKHSMQFPN